MSATSKSCTSKVNTVEKWKESLKAEWLEYNVDDNDSSVVRSLRCKFCSSKEERITSAKNFSRSFIIGSSIVKKHSVVTHMNSDQHKAAEKMSLKEFVKTKYVDEHVSKTPIGRGHNKMAIDDQRRMEHLFNATYTVCKEELPFTKYVPICQLLEKCGVNVGESYRTDRAAAEFSDHISGVMKETLEDDLKNARYYSVLCDGSTDASVKSQELVYVLYLQKDGRTTCKLLSVETADNEDAAGLMKTLKEAFARFGITNFETKLAATSMDGASVNMGKYTGLAARLKELAPWITAVHCFSHRLELAAADAFNATFFAQLDEMLRQIFSLYQKSPKRLRELRKLAEAYEERVDKPVKASGTRWIDHKVRAATVFLENYGLYMQHLEQAATTSPEPQKQKIEGFLKKWRDARFPMYAAIFVDIVGPLRVLSLGLQADENDPVKALRRIKEFHWTMVKLESSDFLTAKFDKFNENCEPVDDEHVYQNVPLSNFAQALNGAEHQRREWIQAIVKCMENRFKDLKEAPVYKHLCPILDTQSWPTEESQLIAHGDESVMKLVQHFTTILKKTTCDVSKDTMLTEWSSLKLLISESYGKTVPYRDVWAAIFSLPAHCSKFSNILNIIELLLITLISNAIVERMFSTMARMKPKLRNRMSRDKFDSLLRISEEGPQVKDDDPTAAIDHWYGKKKRRMGFGGHEYPPKRKNKRTQDDRHAYFSDQESESN